MGIQFNQVSHLYKGNTKKDNLVAIHDINLHFDGSDEFTAIVGKTGSGKSTLMQHMNGLLLPTEGTINVFDTIITTKKRQKINHIRKRVGMVFQFPEYQLFEETVLKDIMFGPKNFGMSLDEAKSKALEAAKLVGLDDELLEKSPFNLSGGQMRRVAIAGIIAMNPDILILDEPTRGLDPQGSKEVMELFKKLHDEYHKSIILITHDMDIIANYAKRVVVLRDGQIVFDGNKRDLFTNPDFESFHLDKPRVLKAVDYLNKLGYSLDYGIDTIDELIKKLKEQNNG